MKTEIEMRKFLEYNGVIITEPIYGGVPKLRVMDLTQLPGSMREQFDERGFFIAPKTEETSKGKEK